MVFFINFESRKAQKEWRTRRIARFLAAIAFFFLFTLGFS